MRAPIFGMGMPDTHSLKYRFDQLCAYVIRYWFEYNYITEMVFVIIQALKQYTSIGKLLRCYQKQEHPLTR